MCICPRKLRRNWGISSNCREYVNSPIYVPVGQRTFSCHVFNWLTKCPICISNHEHAIWIWSRLRVAFFAQPCITTLRKWCKKNIMKQAFSLSLFYFQAYRFSVSLVPCTSFHRFNQNQTPDQLPKGIFEVRTLPKKHKTVKRALIIDL